MSETQQKAVTLADWKKAKDHTIRLPSGVYVDVAIPDLAKMIESGEIPQNLLDAALAATGASERDDAPTKEFILQERQFANRLVQATVSKPKLSEDEVDEIPFEDKVLIVEVATRQRDLDAEGNHIGGLQKSSDFRKFRGLDGFESSVEGL